MQRTRMSSAGKIVVMFLLRHSHDVSLYVTIVTVKMHSGRLQHVVQLVADAARVHPSNNDALYVLFASCIAAYLERTTWFDGLRRSMQLLQPTCSLHQHHLRLPMLYVGYLGSCQCMFFWAIVCNTNQSTSQSVSCL